MPFMGEDNGKTYSDMQVLRYFTTYVLFLRKETSLF